MVLAVGAGLLYGLVAPPHDRYAVTVAS
jgi:hypothetical protein